MASNGTRERADLRGIGDRELLTALKQLVDKDGWVLSETIAQHFNLTSEHPKRNVASRMGWMVRWGLAEGQQGVWHISAEARVLLQDALAEQRASERVARMAEATRVQMVTALSQQHRTMSREARILADREWRHEY